MLTRKQFINRTGVAGAGLILVQDLDGFSLVKASSGDVSLTKFRDPLPTAIPVLKPDTTTHPGADFYEISMLPGSWRFHSQLPKATPTWGYWGFDPRTGKHASVGLGYLGPSIEAKRNRPVIVKWVNKLSGRHPVQGAIDPTIMGNMPSSTYPVGRACPHLHGGFTPAHFDGDPHAWWTARGKHDPARRFYSLPGHDASSAIYWYSNQQPPALIWYHDHAYGITRLNAYAGLAGLYFIRDGKDTGRANNPLRLPAGLYEIPLVIQDKQFYPNGHLFYPTTNGQPASYPHPKWVPAFYGDTAVINATAFPNLEVEPRRYRFRMVNGSQARFYHLFFTHKVSGKKAKLPFYVIGGDQSLLPVAKSSMGIGMSQAMSGMGGMGGMKDMLMLAPGERADVIVDFSKVPMGSDVILENAACTMQMPMMMMNMTPPLPELMRIRVTKRLQSRDMTADPGKGELRLPALPAALIPRITSATKRRQITLRQHFDPMTGAPVELVLNERHFADPVEEKPSKGATEIWEFVNLTMDPHPMHLHLVRFQVLNRQMVMGAMFEKDYLDWVNAGRPAGMMPNLNGRSMTGMSYLMGKPMAPTGSESGWKDTAVVCPHQVLRVVAKFDLPTGLPTNVPTGPAEYVYHCHILEHEENDMMRPFVVV